MDRPNDIIFSESSRLTANSCSSKREKVLQVYQSSIACHLCLVLILRWNKQRPHEFDLNQLSVVRCSCCLSIKEKKSRKIQDSSSHMEDGFSNIVVQTIGEDCILFHLMSQSKPLGFIIRSNFIQPMAFLMLL